MVSRIVRVSSIVCVVTIILAWGCRGERIELSPAAKAFKKDVGDIVEEVSELFLDYLLKDDRTAIRVLLEKYCAGLTKRDRPVNCGIAILDKNCVTLAGQYPEKAVETLDFSDYELVKKAFRDRRVVQGKLFLQDGTKLYAIVAPICRSETVYGLVGLAFGSQKLAELWGISEADFMTVDFNI